MDISSFRFPTDIRFGSGASALVPDLAKQAGVKHPLVVSDKNLQQTQMFQQLLEDFKKQDQRCSFGAANCVFCISYSDLRGTVFSNNYIFLTFFLS